MIDNRNATVVTDAEGKKLVIINDIRFKGKRKIDWDEVKQYIKGYVGDFYEISETAEVIHIGNAFVKEFPGSNSRTALMGATAKAKANSATAIPELIQIATNPKWEENCKEKHRKDAKLGWYRYDIRFALPVYDNDLLVRYNIYIGVLLVNHAENGNKYLYDVIAIKKETRSPQQ
ncbi:MAG: hypothetical protein K6C96_10270 [Butyrivibrio sp.]|nr:hypothetical protein [Butyrivibrio sp.]